MTSRRYPVSPNGQPVRIEHLCDAIVNSDSVLFAKKLEESLNNHTDEGFVMQTMLEREEDHGLVLVFQRVTLMEREQPEEDSTGDPLPPLSTVPPNTRTKH